MATATFTALTVNSTYFVNPQNINQSGVTTSGSTLSGQLSTAIVLQNWVNNSPMPENSMISDVRVDVVCRLDSGSAPTLNLEFQLNPNTLSAQVTSGTLSTLSFGGTVDSTTTWGGFFNSRDFVKNGGFNVLKLWLTNSVGSTISIDSVVLTVTYTTSSTYLLGSRSIYNGTSDGFIDNIPLVSNGTTISNLVTSEDVNRLGDCLVNIERISLSNLNSFFIGPEKSGSQFAYVTTLTFNSLHAVNFPNSISFEVCRSGNFGLYNNSISKIGTTGLVTANTPNTNAILNRIKLDFVSGMGWINNGGTIIPLYVSPRTMYIGTTNSQGFSNPEYFISMTAVSSTFYGDNGGQFTYQDGKTKLIRSAVFPAIADNAITIKLVGIGNE